VDLLIVDGVDITHIRLVDLTKLADQAKAFYDWVESRFQSNLSKTSSLDELLKSCTQSELEKIIRSCYLSKEESDLPLLFDGIGRSYSHSKACFYFFSWLIRDAPQQRLAPLIQRIIKNSGKNRLDVEVSVLAALTYKYRDHVKTFSWDAVREVIIDRLEGSRRSIKGHEKEIIVRTALVTAIEEFFARNGTYGIYGGIEIPDRQVMVGNESYDVSANLLDLNGERIRRILIPIKTRETEGGGHAHLFSRDIASAINAVKYDNTKDYLVVIIVARSWSSREVDRLREIVDHLAAFDLAPGEFINFNEHEQDRLNKFVESVLDGTIPPKFSLDSGR
jgi:hypothetical protein